MMKKKKQAVATPSPMLESKVFGEIQNTEQTEKILFDKGISFDNWKQIPFFAQIEKERKEVNHSIGQKYNLDFEND